MAAPIDTAAPAPANTAARDSVVQADALDANIRGVVTDCAETVRASRGPMERFIQNLLLALAAWPD
jgi:hypothetical protein